MLPASRRRPAAPRVDQTRLNMGRHITTRISPRSPVTRRSTAAQTSGTPQDTRHLDGPGAPCAPAVAFGYGRGGGGMSGTVSPSRGAPAARALSLPRPGSASLPAAVSRPRSSAAGTWMVGSTSGGSSKGMMRRASSSPRATPAEAGCSTTGTVGGASTAPAPAVAVAAGTDPRAGDGGSDAGCWSTTAGCGSTIGAT